MSLIRSNALAGASGQGGGGGGYEIERSLRFNTSDEAHLSKTFSSAGNQKTWTWSSWVKLDRSNYQNLFANLVNNGTGCYCYFSSGKLYFTWDIAVGGVVTVAEYQDFSAWYHFVIVLDSTQSTSTDRVKIYVNGVQQTLTGSYPALNADSEWMDGNPHFIARQTNNYHYGLEGYLADIHFIDGQALAATDFGEYDTNNVWQPKEFDGVYGPLVDQSQTWSNFVSGTAYSGYPITNAFNGDLSNRSLESGSTGHTFTPSSAIAVNSSLRIYVAYGDASATNVLKVNGTDYSSLITVTGDNGWITIPSISSVTSIFYGVTPSGSEDSSVAAIEIDGKILVDSGVSIVDNSFHLDFSDTSSDAALGTDSSGNSNTWTVNNLSVADEVWNKDQTWSTYGTFTNTYTGTYDWPGVFNDGMIYDAYGSMYTTGSAKWVLTSSIACSSKVKIYIHGPGIFTINEGLSDATAITVASSGFQYVETSFSGNISNFHLSTNNGNPYLMRIYVDGKALIDTNIAGPPQIADVFRDSPTNGDPTNDTGVGGELSGNYCTWNPLGELTGGYVRTLTDGNLTAGGNGDSIGTITFGSGKTYFELTVTSASGFSQGYYGIVDTKKEGNRAWSDPFIAAFRDTGALYGTSSTGSAPAAAAVGTIYGIAVDVDNQKMFISVNGTWLNSGNPASGTGASFTGRDFSDYAPLASLNSSDAQTITLNTGQRPFAYTAPSGYKCLCTANLPDPTIEDGSTAFDTKLWTGNGGTMNVTGLNNSPDLVWYKSRSATGYHFLVDTIRGVNKSLHSNATDAELSQTGLTSFNSDGYTLGPNTTIGNTNGESYVGWSWDAGSSNTSVAAGGLNSSLYDQSQTWSGLDTWPTAAYSTTPSHAFNGVASANTADIWYSNAASTVTLTNLAAQLPNPVTTLEVYTFDRTGTITITVNGTAHAFPNVGDYAWNTVNVNAQITSLTIAGTDSSYWGIGAIKVNGKILADSGVTPPNLPSIASTVRANPSAGFSIVSYTGDGAAGTIAHNLNAKPDFVITKNRTTANYWAVWHSSLTANKFLRLDLDNAEDTESNYWTDFDSNVVHVPGSGSALNNVNNSSKEYISYCFAPVEGYSAFGSYVGNGSSSGPFVYTGFKTRWVMMKKSSGAGSWVMYDTTRDTAGSGEGWLYANSNSSEQAAATYAIHTTSNGFRMAGTSGENNGSGATYIYAAFAEHPFKTARAR